MNKREAIEFLADHGIHQLRKGETLADAIRSVEEGTQRVGYEYLHRDGTPMSENQIIMASNREAFMKFTPKEYCPDEVEDIDDICARNDFRECRDERGIMVNCYYCGTTIRVDAGGREWSEDYCNTDPLVHCSDCMRDAIANNAM